MLFSFSFYSSFLLIFFIHLLVYAGLFMLKYIRSSQKASLWMSLFLFLSALYITPWMVGFAGWYDTQPYRDFLFYFPFQHLLLLGPVLFFYTQSLLNPSLKMSFRQGIHFVPAIIYLIYCVWMVIYDKMIAHDYIYLASGEDPDFAPWYQILGFSSMTLYLVAGFLYVRRYQRSVSQVLSNMELYLYPWLSRFFFACMVLLSIRATVGLIAFFWDLTYINSWWYFLSYAICCYYIAIFSYSNAAESKTLFHTDVLSTNQTFWASANTLDEEYIAIPIEAYDTLQELPSELIPIKTSLIEYLDSRKVFLNPELTLVELAKALQTNASILSKVINKGLGQSFNDLINQYRINEVIIALEKGIHKNQTLLSIAFDCGFNSKATFNRAFKKVTGFSPIEYLAKNAL